MGATMQVTSDGRFDVPLYTFAEAARALEVSPTTLVTWGRGYKRVTAGRPPVVGAPVITAVSGTSPGEPSIPFIGLTEGMVLAAMRHAGVPMQRIRPTLDALSEEMGIDHALASKRLFTDGAELLFDYAGRSSDPHAGDTMQLVVVRNGQHVFVDVIEQYLRRIEYSPADGYAQLIHLPGYQVAEVVADPTRSFGQPILAHGGVRVADVLGRFWAGEDLAIVAEDYGLRLADIEDVVRVASRRAA
ncbi:MAG: DUF433 domain-containing protein [Actinomycetota bacterium]|nr:DUF433 domain-containing protein [Actinomycetota bacterium]